MCFSVGASFGAAAGLSIIGLLSLHKAWHTKKLIPIAASPFFFAMQQACEGFVWLTLNAGDTTSIFHKFGMYGFLFFAACWWPIWIPIALHIAEAIRVRKQLLLICLCIGTFSAISLFFNWILQTTGAVVINHHIDYPVANYPYSITQTTATLAYCIAIIVPCFISSIAYVWILGITVGVGLIISYLFYYMTLQSVWCFFAAISSILLYFIIKKTR